MKIESGTSGKVFQTILIIKYFVIIKSSQQVLSHNRLSDSLSH